MISVNNSYDLLKFLKEKKLLENSSEFWWPNSNDFEIVIGAILTQNTKWTNVEKSLENLRKLNLLSLEAIADADLMLLIEAITPSGFKNQKSKRLILLCKNIIEEFQYFSIFQKKVDRTWLLNQKGIGPETADAILCYGCRQDYMVVDSYTNRLLKQFDYDFESYDELQEWLVDGINENLDKIFELYKEEISLNKIYARLHGKIVEYMKQNPKG